MPRNKWLDSVRDVMQTVRLSGREKKILKRRAAGAQISVEQYIRSKTFDYPFEAVGGKPPRPK